MILSLKNWKNWRVVRFFAAFGRIYLGKRLPRTAAAMTYFMVLTLFPGIICLYDLLALAVAKPEAVFQVLETLVVPEQTRSIIEEFLRYAARSANGTVFVVAFVAMVIKRRKGRKDRKWRKGGEGQERGRAGGNTRDRDLPSHRGTQVYQPKS